MEKIIHTIAPVYDENSRVLLLGSMPSPKSREAGFYYGNPHNRFWTVLSAVFNDDTGKTKEEKTAFLLRHHVALWDVLHSCEIAGASDASIRSAEVNDFSAIFAAAPIRVVFFTGIAAHRYFTKNVRCNLPAIRLPSTSPANAAWSIDRLIEAYSVIKDYI